MTSPTTSPTAYRSLSNTDELIDTRDLQERLDALTALTERDAAEEQEYRHLTAFVAELRDYCADYEYGETLIHESYFVRYTEELAHDIGAIDARANWPCNCIDWELAADMLKQDYTCADFGGQTYWFRSS